MPTLTELENDAEQKLARQNERRRELEQRFKELAYDKPWFDGIFPHQWQAACFGAVAKRWFLGDEMGLGKTRTAIGWLDLVNAKKVIIIAEANVAAQFGGELMNIAPHRDVYQLTGLTKKTRHDKISKLVNNSEAVAVINYEMFRQDTESLARILAWQADTIIVDESHNLKNTKTVNFKTVQRILFIDNTCENCGALITNVKDPCVRCNHTQEIAGMTKEQLKKDFKGYLRTKSIKNVLLMSGTPLLNSPEDLFSSFHLIDPVKFPRIDSFRKAFLKPSYATGSRRLVFKRNGLDLLYPYVKNFYLARSKTDVGELQEDGSVILPGGLVIPAKHERVVRVELDPEKYPLQHRTVQQVNNHAQISLSTGEKHNIMHILALITRKRQANVWPGGIEIRDKNTGDIIFSVAKEVQESCKMDAALEQIIAYYKQGKRQVVFSQFKTALEEFEKRITKAGIRAARLDGSTPQAKRQEIKNNFYRARNEEPKWDVVLVHYRTGGAGLNLTAATVMHILDEEWNEGKRDQAYGRTNRIGQTETTEHLVYRIPNSIDTYMSRLISEKGQMSGALKKRLSNKELILAVGEAILKGEV